MNNLKPIARAYRAELIEKYGPGFIAVFLVLLFIVSTGLLAAGAMIYKTYHSAGLSDLELCFSNACVAFWIKNNGAALSVLALTGSAIIGVVTIGGIVVALFNYKNSVHSSAITNHLSHLTIFMDYVRAETSRRSRLSPSEVEPLKWYNLIYKQSLAGRFTTSVEYVSFLTKICNLIESSNKKYCSANKDSRYSYKNNQTEMISILFEAGIYLERLPRINFNEVEVQVLNLIESVNKSFCKNELLPSFPERLYH
jgi:hypothetical protein